MFSARITIFGFLVSLIAFQHTDAWRRRRRRQCSPVGCKVSSWSPWSSCNADKCGQQGSRQRTRTEVSPSSCGGEACPELTETIPCSSTEKVDCQVSPWSEWSACTTPCGLSGIQFSSRHRIITEQCGGTCVSIFRKNRACPELKCLNGGSLKKGTCFCKESFVGSCCEKGKWTVNILYTSGTWSQSSDTINFGFVADVLPNEQANYLNYTYLISDDYLIICT